MTSDANTLFLRMEGHLQSWGDNSKFVIRRTMEAPTKSGVFGVVCSALGLSRQRARDQLAVLKELAIGVRFDRPGTRWWDYHTVGAGQGVLTASGKIKRTATSREIETLVTRREYLCDASFLVALQGDPESIHRVHDALENPRWPAFLGRRSCAPSAPVVAKPGGGETWTNPSRHEDLAAALRSVPWRARSKKIDGQPPPRGITCLIEWRSRNGEAAPANAEVWYDTPVSFDPPFHEARLVQRVVLQVETGNPFLNYVPPPPRPRADYRNTEYHKTRAGRLEADHFLCVFCKARATTVQHVTYRRAGGQEMHDDLRSLCRLCHDAVTMIEYGLGMGLDRIDPEHPRWRSAIIAKRQEIIQFRSLESRRRSLRSADPQEVKSELLEEEA